VELNWSSETGDGVGVRERERERERGGGALVTSKIEEYLCHAFNLKFMVHLGGRNTSFLWGYIPRSVELPL
jgi:hypothetical protein